MMTSHAATVRALVRFHLAAGARVALRANAVVAAIFVFVFGMAPDGIPIFHILVLGTVSSARGWDILAIFAGVCLALAATALPRVTLGLGGWMRSLPASRLEHRAAAIVALAATQLFSILWTALAIVVTVFVFRAPLSIAKLLTIPVIIVAVATFVVLTADRSLRKRDPSPVGIWPWIRANRFAYLHWVRFSWSAVPASATLGSLILPTVFIAFAYMILLHNPGIDPPTAHRTVRISGSLAVGAIAASLSNAMLRMRPTWAWSRSLPWSSSQRIFADTIAVALPTFVVAATLLPLDAINALPVLATIPAIAAASAHAIRAGASRQTGAAGEIVIVATIAGALIALSPWLAIISLLGTPTLFNRGAARDRRTISSRFTELQHDASADSAWLGAR